MLLGSFGHINMTVVKQLSDIYNITLWFKDVACILMQLAWLLCDLEKVACWLFTFCNSCLMVNSLFAAKWKFEVHSAGIVSFFYWSSHSLWTYHRTLWLSQRIQDPRSNNVFLCIQVSQTRVDMGESNRRLCGHVKCFLVMIALFYIPLTFCNTSYGIPSENYMLKENIGFIWINTVRKYE